MSNKDGSGEIYLPGNDPTLGSFHRTDGGKVDISITDIATFAKMVDLSNLGILSIDTEGHDIYILARMLSSTEIRPKILITESWHWNFEMNQIKDEMLLVSGYKQILSVHENDIYIKQDKEEGLK